MSEEEASTNPLDWPIIAKDVRPYVVEIDLSAWSLPELSQEEIERLIGSEVVSIEPETLTGTWVDFEPEPNPFGPDSVHNRPSEG